MVNMKVFNCFSVFHIYQSLLFFDPNVKNIFIVNFDINFDISLKYKNVTVVYKNKNTIKRTYYKIFNYSLLIFFKLINFVFKNKKKYIEYYSSPHHSSILASYYRAQASKNILFNEGYYSSLTQINNKINPLYKNTLFSKFLLFNFFNLDVSEFIYMKQFHCNQITSSKNKLINPIHYYENVNKYYDIFFKFDFFSIKDDSLLILLSSDCYYRIISRIDFEKKINKIIKNNLKTFKYIYLKAHPFDNNNYEIFYKKFRNVLILPNHIPYEIFMNLDIRFKKTISLSNSINEL